MQQKTHWENKLLQFLFFGLFWLFYEYVSLQIFHLPFVNDCESYSNEKYNYILDARIFRIIWFTLLQNKNMNGNNSKQVVHKV